MLVVVALGGNALLRRGEPADASRQRENVRQAATALAGLAAIHRLVVTHGNGPQVGLLALQNAAYDAVAPYPMDVLDAESEGMIGYVIDQELRNLLPGRDVAALLTQVEVAAADPAFAAPDKPIGPVYDEDTARQLADARGWAMALDGERWRRVVPSPRPRRIVELETIRLLVGAGVIVICAGGGGIPVVVDGAGGLRGVEAVIDKDATSALLADRLGADALLLLTDVDAVYTDWDTPDARALRRVSPDCLRDWAFAAGSMGPKVAAAVDFIERGGSVAAIGALGDAVDILAGRAGTRVVAGPDVIERYDTA